MPGRMMKERGTVRQRGASSTYTKKRKKKDSKKVGGKGFEMAAGTLRLTG